MHSLHRGIGNKSTSSVWGSAGAHFTKFGDRRFLLDTASLPETKVSLHIDNHNDMLSGSRNVVCSTEAEHKANKLNRSEQAKLEKLQMRVTKEKELFQRRFRQTEKVFRAKSAKAINRSKSLEASVAARPASLYSNWRPQTTAVKSEKMFVSTNTSQPCEMCLRIQEVIRSYELDGQQKGIFDHVTDGDHSTCLFSDAQARAFLGALETELRNEAPRLSTSLREGGLLNHQEKRGAYFARSREEMDHRDTTRNIEARIRQFCVDIDRYNTKNVSIPKAVKDALEKVRLNDAIAKSERPRLNRERSSRSRMKKEVLDTLETL